MTQLLQDPRLVSWARQLEELKWSAHILDSEWRLVWVSKELMAFLDAGPETNIGLGLHALEAYTQPAWLDVIDQESQLEIFVQLAPFVLRDFRDRGRDPAEVLPEPFLPLLKEVEPAERSPMMWSGSFLYLDPRTQDKAPRHRVNLLYLRMNDDDGSFIGTLMLSFMGVRPNLLSLLASGDERMYERMAKLTEPGPRQAAILFCDLHHSGSLSRQLPSAAYFKLVRRLWSEIDAVVADEKGIIGKHAGDGASAFFLVDDLGSDSGAAAGTIRAARRIHDISESIFEEVTGTGCMMKLGLHWGGSLYMGQLVPGGRLDVTALGDEVNETARLEESAGPGETLVSKQLLERLTDADAASVGMDLEKLSYRLLSDLESASEKAVRDAGGLAVTVI